jgi:hypothetical protein
MFVEMWVLAALASVFLSWAAVVAGREDDARR